MKFKTLLRHVWGLVWVYLSHKHTYSESVFVYASCCYSVTVDTEQNSHDCTFIKYLLFYYSPTKEAEADIEPLWLTFTSTHWPPSLRSKSCMTKMKTKQSPTLWLWQPLWWYLINTLISTLWLWSYFDLIWFEHILLLENKGIGHKFLKLRTPYLIISTCSAVGDVRWAVLHGKVKGTKAKVIPGM